MPGGEITVNDIASLASRLVDLKPNLSQQEWKVLQSIFVSGADNSGNITFDAVKDPNISPKAQMVKQITDRIMVRQTTNKPPGQP